MLKRSLGIIALLVCFSSLSFAQRTILHCGRLIDGKTENARSQVSVIIEGNKIVAIESGFTRGRSNDTVIDLKQQTVLPGLMDMHVHIESQNSPARRVESYTLNPADVAYNAQVYAERTLMAGFTTVRDLGGSGVNVSLKKAINAGKVKGPRIYTAEKTIATTGGHGDPTNGGKVTLLGDPGPKEGVINSEADARKAIRQRYKNGADVIKITATGGVLSVAKDGQGPQFQMDELKGIVETAKEYGFVTAAHAHGDEGMYRAVLAGINSIEHGTFMSQRTMDLMIEKGTYYVPTISAGKFVVEKAQIPGYFPAVVVPKALEVGPKIQGTFAEAYKRGVKIAFGTDAGVFPHGENGKEFIYMVEAGMSPMEAIKSATMTASELLRIDDQYGSIEAGKMADIVAVEGNPLTDISNMTKVKFVMKNGVVYKD
ncbi:amidohydrolase family protein [Roseivirga sp. E12]|uniref:amidohydrolase family protein n=1 Tax=Roseivirga sp. E12 TaxID=2819237 RepID=UPI001ABC04D3|nr:amidohydrolase family protein [Roseivirga sp. E12]MBO3700710.1 amidohydrolase family protein [Roseivirga sp. E12]